MNEENSGPPPLPWMQKPQPLPIVDKMRGNIDLDTIDGIQSIEIPKYEPLQGIQSPTDNIEYILQRKATEHKRNGRMDLAIACLRKSNEIFPHSNFLWSYKDYMRLVNFLKEDGKFDEAKAEEKKITDHFAINSLTVSVFWKVLEDCKSIKTDLVISGDNNRVCAECARYTRRIFSISGKDRRFPTLPKYFGLDFPEHKYCYNSLYPFFGLDYATPTWSYIGNLLTWCNRPFSDERTREQKNNFKKWVINNEQEVVDQANYDFLLEHLPDVAPKSFSGFRRMKNMRSNNYLILMKLAHEKGRNLDVPLDLSIFEM